MSYNRYIYNKYDADSIFDYLYFLSNYLTYARV